MNQAILLSSDGLLHSIDCRAKNGKHTASIFRKIHKEKPSLSSAEASSVKYRKSENRVRISISNIVQIASSP